VRDLIELAWVAVPLPAGGSYPAARAQLEALMAARKATRKFGPSPAEASQRLPKSSIDDSRESVIPEPLYAPRGADRTTRRRYADNLFNTFGAGQAERLSGVDLLKRHGLPVAPDADFPSTSHFAALPLLVRLLRAGYAVTSGLTAYVGTLRGRFGAHPVKLASRFQGRSPIDGYDASLLFPSRLIDLVDQDDVPEAQDALREYLKQATARQEPGAYYALLHADGDAMGAVIDNQQSPDAHRALSRQLDGFARSVREVVEEQHDGALVYAGGDDVLAFLPLHTALGCTQALATAFGQAMRDYKSAEDVSPTLSVGLAICHHLEPLSDALDLARAAEKAAKGVVGKNALAITLSKRSGADVTIRGSWSSGFFERLEQFVALHRAEALPDGAAYDLRRLSAQRRRSLRSTCSRGLWRAATCLVAGCRCIRWQQPGLS
jgi:CRISPR-associated protein Cmr2